MSYEEKLEALDLYSNEAHDKAEEAADETCDMFGLEGEERTDYWNTVYYAEYDRLMDEYDKTL